MSAAQQQSSLTHHQHTAANTIKSTQPSTNNSDSLSNDHSQLSEANAPNSGNMGGESTENLRQQVKELHEKLIFANETIALMEEREVVKKTKAKSDADEEDDEAASDGEDDEAQKVGQMIRKVQMQKVNSSLTASNNSNLVMDQVETLQQKIDYLEMQNAELENEIDTSKVKAKELLMKKDLQEKRIKIIIQKLESHMKNEKGMTKEEVNQVGQLTEDELQLLYEMESDIQNEV